jgi:hypothetical protein
MHSVPTSGTTPCGAGTGSGWAGTAPGWVTTVAAPGWVAQTTATTVLRSVAQAAEDTFGAFPTKSFVER